MLDDIISLHCDESLVDLSGLLVGLGEDQGGLFISMVLPDDDSLSLLVLVGDLLLPDLADRFQLLEGLRVAHLLRRDDGLPGVGKVRVHGLIENLKEFLRGVVVLVGEFVDERSDLDGLALFVGRVYIDGVVDIGVSLHDEFLFVLVDVPERLANSVLDDEFAVRVIRLVLRNLLVLLVIDVVVQGLSQYQSPMGSVVFLWLLALVYDLYLLSLGLGQLLVGQLLGLSADDLGGVVLRELLDHLLVLQGVLAELGLDDHADVLGIGVAGVVVEGGHLDPVVVLVHQELLALAVDDEEMLAHLLAHM